MSKENSAERRHGLAWPWVILIMAVGTVAGMSLAVLLIPQFSVNAAVRAGTFAFFSTLLFMYLPKALRHFRPAKRP
jgi:hypothetical protein